MTQIWLLIIIIYSSPIQVGEYTSKANCLAAEKEFHKGTNVLRWPFRNTASDSGCISILKQRPRPNG